MLTPEKIEAAYRHFEIYRADYSNREAFEMALRERFENKAATNQAPPLDSEHPAMWPVVMEERSLVDGVSCNGIVFQNRLLQTVAMYRTVYSTAVLMAQLQQRDLLADMQARHERGLREYGKPLCPFNGHDQLLDAYQELLDGCVYLRAAIYEMEHDMELTSSRKNRSEPTPGG